MKTKHTIIRSFLLTATVAGACMSGSAFAASACKGLDNAACGANASCGWVEGYERKDGRKVKSFCRTTSSAKKSVDQPAKKAPAKKSG